MSEQITTDTEARRINLLHEELTGLARRSLNEAIKIGELLADKKAMLKHGEWLPWCRGNLAFSQASTTKYLALHRNRAKLLAASNLGVEEAYRALCQPAQPDPEPEEESQESPQVPPSVEAEETTAPPAEDSTPSTPRTVDAEVVSEPEDEEEQAAPEPLDCRPDDAMDYAMMAIAQLERISRRDRQRKQAFDKVIAYCERRNK